MVGDADWEGAEENDGTGDDALRTGVGDIKEGAIVELVVAGPNEDGVVAVGSSLGPAEGSSDDAMSVSVGLSLGDVVVGPAVLAAAGASVGEPSMVGTLVVGFEVALDVDE